MPATAFTYQALDATGKVVKGRIESASQEAAAQALAVQRLTPVALAPAGRGLQREIKLPGLGRVKLTDLAVFSRQFASMMTAGLSLVRTLGILEAQTGNALLKEALGAVRVEVTRGETLSTALGQHPKVFPTLMVNMIRAGEAGGFLDQALGRIAVMYEADATLRAKIKGALTYPVIVLCFSLLLGAGMMIFIVPVFQHMFAQLGGALPLPTRILVALSHNIWWWGPLVLVLVIGGTVGYRRTARKSPAFRLAVDKLKLRLPVFGSLFAKVAISRWARNLATLLHVGVPVMQALDVVGGTAGNAVVGAAMADVKQAVRVGQPMSGPLGQHKIFPPMVVQMVEVGEETGQITDMLDKTAEYYEQEVQTAAAALASALEPLLVVFLGAVVGLMVISLYLPMFTIYQHIPGAN